MIEKVFLEIASSVPAAVAVLLMAFGFLKAQARRETSFENAIASRDKLYEEASRRHLESNIRQVEVWRVALENITNRMNVSIDKNTEAWGEVKTVLQSSERK